LVIDYLFFLVAKFLYSVTCSSELLQMWNDLLKPYLTQKARLPKNRRFLVAQDDDESVVVY